MSGIPWPSDYNSSDSDYTGPYEHFIDAVLAEIERQYRERSMERLGWRDGDDLSCTQAVLFYDENDREALVIHGFHTDGRIELAQDINDVYSELGVWRPDLQSSEAAMVEAFMRFFPFVDNYVARQENNIPEDPFWEPASVALGH